MPDDYCPCIEGDYDYFGSGFWCDYNRTARKEWVCEECSCRISRGSKYQETTGLSDGSFYRIRTCFGCVDVRSAVYCGGYTHGELWEDIRENAIIEKGKPIEQCILKELNVAGAQKIKEQWWKAQQ